MSSIDTLAYASILDNGSPDQFREAARLCDIQVPGPHNGCQDNASEVFQDIAHYSPTDYATFLRFYQVKPLYTSAATLLHRKLKLPAFIALRFISSVSYVLIGLVLFLWLSQHLSVLAASVMALLIAATPSVLELGKDLRPDAFSTALLLSIIFAILYLTEKLWARLLLLAILPLARPDNILFCTLMAAALIYRATPIQKDRWLRLAGLAFAAIVLHLLLQRLTHPHPYVVFFNHSFLAWTPPATYSALHLSVRVFLHTILVCGFKTLILFFPLPLVFTVLALADPTSWRPLRDLLWVALLTCGCRLLLFPLIEARYYTWFYLLAAVGATITLSGRIPASTSWFSASQRTPTAHELQ